MDERSDGAKSKKEGRDGKSHSEGRRGTGFAAVVKVTSLPCEVEWYLNLTCVATMSIRCRLCVCV